ncbi:MAG: hypothetical protein JWO07_711 [Candidatus Saccharibacteria bacterium]|nr:hypothetical protein [Candidatus Saccharibacteria bacterium]
MDDQPQKKSYKLVWIAGASFAVFVVILGTTFMLVSQSTKNDKTASKTTAASSSAKVASKEDVKNSLDKLSASLKQAATAQTAAKAALASKPVKVGN